MKRVVATILSMVMVFFLFTTAFADGAGYMWIVDAPSGVNVRNAKKGGDIVGLFRKGYCFRVVEEDNYWVGTVLQDGTIGYIYKENCHIAHAEEIEEFERKQREGIELTYDDCTFIGEIKEDCKVYRQANGKIIGEYQAGDIVYIRKLGQYWYRIIYDNKKVAYVQTSKIKLIDLNIPGEGEARIIRDGDDASDGRFVIRSAPSTNSEKVITLNEGTYVKVLDESFDGGWALVAYNVEGDTGYIAKKWLRKTGLFN